MTSARVLFVAVALWAGALALPAGARQDPPQQPQRPPVFRTNVDAVRIDVLAVDKGKPIPGLTPADFEVKDNGVLQSVDLATLADHVSVSIALDVQPKPWGGSQELIKACKILAGALKPADRAWLVTFAQSFDLRVGPTSDPDVLRQALDRVVFARGMSMWDTIFSSTTLVAGLDGRSLVIVFSDGMETFFKAGWLDEKHAIEDLKRGEVTVNAVQPRSLIASPTALERAARATGGIVIEAERNAHLVEQFTKLLDEFRLGYILTFTPKGVAKNDGWHKLSVSLKNRSGKVTAKQGYYAGMR
jgi:VWFA-related protein